MQVVGAGEVLGATGSAPQIKHCHRPGWHCGSSAIRDLLEFHGLDLTEAFCFGLGAGLGITYVEIPDSATPFIVHVRSMGFEESVFRTLGVPFAWSSYTDKQAATADLYEALRDGVPTLLLTDIYHLPYFGSGTHFPGHAIVAWQLDEARDEVLVSDTERPELISVPAASLADARFSTSPPFVHYGNLFAPRSLKVTVSAEQVRAAIIDNARALAEGNRNSGLSALDTWIELLPRWRAEENWRWLLRFAYQVIEKRGTGGAGFRAMYADFLLEAGEMLPAVHAANLVGLMQCSATAWSGLAALLKMASESDVFPIREIEAAITRVKLHETQYVHQVISKL
ncbi:MAG: BtrH N-terminal domain-containing protein [Pseudomonadota bacterium]